MRPESTSVSLRKDLSAVVAEYDATAAALQFIAPMAAPVFSTPEQNGNFPIFRRDAFKKPAQTKHSDGAGYNRLQGRFGVGTFSTEEHGLEYAVTDRRAKLYSSYFDSEAAGARILRHQMLLAREQRVAALYSGGGWTNHAASTAWHTSASAVPLDDIQTGVETLSDNTGLPPEMMTLIIPRAGFREALATAQVAAKSTYTYPGIQPAMLSAQMFAAMLGIRRVLVAGAAYDSASEGATETNAQVWASTITYLTVLAEPNADLESPSAARTMVWSNYADGTLVESYRDDTSKSNILRLIEETDEILMGPTDLFVYQITH